MAVPFTICEKSLLRLVKDDLPKLIEKSQRFGSPQRDDSAADQN